MAPPKIFGYGALLALFVITLAVLLPARVRYHFFEDDYRHLENVRRMSQAPGAVFAVEGKDQRRHPLYYALLFTETKFFGEKVLAYFGVHYLFHLLNAILVMRLAWKFGASVPAGQLAGLLFLGSAAFYNILIKLTGTLELQGLFFFLLAVLAWFCFLEGSRLAILRVVLFQMAALLTYEVAVVFPLLACALTFIFEKNVQKRLRIFWKVLLPMLILSLLVFWGLTRDFWFSQALQSKIAPQSAFLLILKFVTFFRMFAAPVFEKGQGPFPFFLFDFGLRLMLPVFVAAAAVCIYLWRTNRFAGFLKRIPEGLIRASVLWIAVTLAPHLPYPGDFAHATRYMLFPAVGMTMILAIFLSGFFDFLKQLFPRAGVVLSVLTLCYMLGINLWAVSFQFERYQNYLQEHPGEDFTAKVKGLAAGSSAFPARDVSL